MFISRSDSEREELDGNISGEGGEDDLNGDGELHPLVTITEIDPDEVPEVVNY